MYQVDSAIVTISSLLRVDDTLLLKVGGRNKWHGFTYLKSKGPISARTVHNESVFSSIERSM